MARHPNGHFQKGTGGRPAGSRNKLQAKVFDSLLREWEAYGDEVLRIVRAEDPAIWLKVITAVLPRELLVTDDRVSQLSDDEISEYLDALPVVSPKKIDDRTEH